MQNSMNYLGAPRNRDRIKTKRMDLAALSVVIEEIVVKLAKGVSKKQGNVIYVLPAALL